MRGNLGEGRCGVNPAQRRHWLWLWGLLWLAGASVSTANESIRARFEAVRAGFHVEAGGDMLLAPLLLSEFYEDRHFEPAWSRPGKDGTRQLLAGAQDMLVQLELAALDGLNPEDYHLDAVQVLKRQIEESHRDADFNEIDLLLSDAFLMLGNHLASGKVNAETLDAEWIPDRRHVEMVPILNAALQQDEVAVSLDRLRPGQSGYARLRALRQTYAQLAEEVRWSEVPEGVSIKPGMDDPRIPAIRSHLLWMGDWRPSPQPAPADAAAEGTAPPLPAEETAGAIGQPAEDATETRAALSESEGGDNLSLDEGDDGQTEEDTSWDEETPPEDRRTLYDEELQSAVKHFQARLGLEVDGIIGAGTLAALNVSPRQRLHQIDVNLERWRWLPADMGYRHVRVNTASFELKLVEDRKVILRKRVVVGRDYRRTPAFSDKIRYIVFNPTWTVPPKLALEDKLPQIRRDPSYLSRLGFTVFQGWGEARQEVDPANVDWSALNQNNFPYYLVQSPGPMNALGQVKFMFPNRFDVYLHDTPSRDLFQHAQRAFSSGCIRVQQPLDLAEMLLQDTPGWDRKHIDEVVASQQTTTVSLRQPIPIHLQYWTAWVEADAVPHFRKDIYDRDARVYQALQARPFSIHPASSSTDSSP